MSLSKSVCGLFKRNFLVFQQFLSLTDSIPDGFCSQKLWGLIFLALEPWAGGLGVGLELLAPKISLLNFYGFGTGLFRVCTPLTSLDGCGFFNSIVVRLPFSSISDVPK